MKIFAFVAASLAAIFSSPAAPPTWQELSSHLFTNEPIIWQAPINNLPHPVLFPRARVRANVKHKQSFPHPSGENLRAEKTFPRSFCFGKRAVRGLTMRHASYP
jgi:hypothetical protein